MDTKIWRKRLHNYTVSARNVKYDMGKGDLPTAFSSMMAWACVFAADMVAGLTEVVLKNLRRNEMLGNCSLASMIWS